MNRYFIILVVSVFSFFYFRNQTLSTLSKNWSRIISEIPKQITSLNRFIPESAKRFIDTKKNEYQKIATKYLKKEVRRHSQNLAKIANIYWQKKTEEVLGIMFSDK